MHAEALRRSTTVTLAAICVGIVARLAFLTIDSFWLDEAFSVQLVSQTTVASLWAGADPRHPPLYYLILKSALHALGSHEVSARLPSAVASVFSLSLVYMVARRLRMSREAALLASALTALSAIDIWYAREARMYALATMAGLVAAIGLIADEWWGMAVTVLGVALAIYLDFTVIPLMAALVGLWWARWWHTGRRPWPAARLVFALAVAGLVIRPLWPQIAQIAAALDGVTFFSNLRRVAGLPHLSPSRIVVVLLGEVAAVAIAGGLAWKLLRAGERRLAIAWAAAIAFALVNAVLVVPRAYSAKQILVTCWPLLALATAWAVSRGSRGPMYVALGVSLAASASSLAVHRADWRGVARYVTARASPEALVVVDPSWDRVPYEHYAAVRPAPALFAATGDTKPLERAGDVWLVAERYGPPPPSSATEAWLDRHARLIEVVPFSRLEVRRYRAAK